MTKPPTCRWDGQRWTKPDDTACNEDHCAMRGSCPNHVQHAADLITCPACIRRVRKDLDAIVERYALLPFDAIIDGIDGEAMNLLGPAAAPQQYAEKRRRIAAAYDDQGWCEWPRSEGYRPDDQHHPYVVLTRWAHALEDGGWFANPSPWHWDVVRAATDIKAALDRFAHGREFPEMARELAACRNHLDTVDHDSRTPDLGRPCPTCTTEHGKGPRLRKRHASHPGMRPGQRCNDSLCPICSGRADAWHCPDNPAHAWTDDEYRNRVDADYVQHADRLPVRELSDRTGVPASTIRRWASTTKKLVGTEMVDIPPSLRPAGRSHDGRRVYRVSDIEALRGRAVASGA